MIGARDFEITVNTDPQQLETRGLSIDDVVAAITASNVTVPAGTFQSRSRSTEMISAVEGPPAAVRLAGKSSALLRATTWTVGEDPRHPRGA